MNKEKGRKLVGIKEQVIEDLVTGLTIEFKAREDGEIRLYLNGSTLPFGNREFHFDKNGQYVGTGTWLHDASGDNHGTSKNS